MDLEEFTSPLPKPWLNINANSVHVGGGGGGGPVTFAQFVQYVSVTASNPQTPVSLTANAAHTGSLTLPPLPVGSVVRVKMPTTTGITAGALTIALTNNGTPIASITLDGTNTQPAGFFDALLIMGTNYVNATLSFVSVLSPNIVTQQQSAFSLAGPNVLDLTARYSASGGGNAVTAIGIVVEVVNGN